MAEWNGYRIEKEDMSMSMMMRKWYSVQPSCIGRMQGRVEEK